jgi:ankyrin repeat protein
MTPLFCLPEDDDQAVEIVELLLAHGTDPTIRNRDGETAADYARKRGLDDAGELIGSASG